MLSPIQRIVVQDGTHTTYALVPSFFRTTILQEILSFPFIFLRKLRLGKLKSFMSSLRIPSISHEISVAQEVRCTLYAKDKHTPSNVPISWRISLFWRTGGLSPEPPKRDFPSGPLQTQAELSGAPEVGQQGRTVGSALEHEPGLLVDPLETQVRTIRGGEDGVTVPAPPPPSRPPSRRSRGAWRVAGGGGLEEGVRVGKGRRHSGLGEALGAAA